MATCVSQWFSSLWPKSQKPAVCFEGSSCLISCLCCACPSASTAWTGCCSHLSQKTWWSKCPKLQRAASGETPHTCTSIWRWVHRQVWICFTGLNIPPCNHAYLYPGFTSTLMWCCWTLGFRPKPARSVDWQWPSIRSMRKCQWYPGGPLSRTSKALSKSTAAFVVNQFHWAIQLHCVCVCVWDRENFVIVWHQEYFPSFVRSVSLRSSKTF